MSYQKDRDEFVGVIVEEISKAPRSPHDATNGEWRQPVATELARLILRNAATIQRLAERACNPGLTPGEDLQEIACSRRIAEACKPWGIKPTFDGDPRGACVKLVLPSGRYNSFGGRECGYCVPTR